MSTLYMVGLKGHMAQFKDVYLSEDHSHMSVNDMWVKFKTGFVEAVERFIPSKMIKNKILCAMDRCNDQTACKKENPLGITSDISFTFVLANQRTLMSRFITSSSEHMFRRH